MCGAANTVRNAVKSPTRTLTGVITGGQSELWRASVPGASKVGSLADKTIDGRLFGRGTTNIYGGGGGTENPAQTLAQTGGAPLLANIALGAKVEDTLAGYFGASDYKTFYSSLSDQDKQLVDGVKNQLDSIQQNTTLRNQAVSQVVQDFPNIASQAASARQASGQEFDSVTKGYIDQALQGTAAKYAAGGGLSSGAMNEASAKVGAQHGMDKLNYMDTQYQSAYNEGVQGWQARYNETNALRNFQNLMTQGAAGQGFSAVQASLNRNQQTNVTNAGYANQQKLQNQQNDNALFGAIGGLAGTVAGGMMFGPAGAGLGGTVGRAAGSGASTGGTNYSFPQGSSYAQPYGTFSGNPRLNLDGR